MKITRENYEAYFLDYHEGALSDSCQKELMDFLVENPDLRDEFDAFEMIKLEDHAPGTVFLDKEMLKKPVEAPENDLTEVPSIEHQMIAFYEGDLSDEQRSVLMKVLAVNPKARRDFDLYGKTRLQPDTSVVFKNKSSLKRYTLGVTMPQLRKMAIAAGMLAFMAGLFFLLPDITKTPEVATTPAYETPAPIVLPNNNEVEEQQPMYREDQSETNLINPVEAPSTGRFFAHEAAPQTREIESSPSSFSIQIASIEKIKAAYLPMANRTGNIEKRDEFFWFTYITGDEYLADDYHEEGENDYSSEEIQSPARFSLASIAYNEIERSTGIDIRAIEEQVSDRRFGLWDIAGYGLAGISQLTGTSLTFEKELDESGRIRSLGIGERFRISR